MFNWFSHKQKVNASGKQSPAEVSGPYHRIVLAVDGTDTSTVALQHAVDMAADLGAELRVLAVVDTISLEFLLKNHVLIQTEVDEFEVELKAKCSNFLMKAMAVAAGSGVSCETKLARGRFDNLVASEVTLSKADMLVLGYWEKSDAAGRELFSRIRQQLVMQISCPTWVVREKDAM